MCIRDRCARPVCVAAVTPVELMACDLNQLYAYMEKSAKLMQLMLQLLSNTCNHLTAQLRRITLYLSLIHIYFQICILFRFYPYTVFNVSSG